MTVIMKIADDRGCNVTFAQACDNVGNGTSRFACVHRHSNKFRARQSEGLRLRSRRADIGCVGIRHRLDRDGMIPANPYPANIHRHSYPPLNFGHWPIISCLRGCATAERG